MTFVITHQHQMDFVRALTLAEDMRTSLLTTFRDVGEVLQQGYNSEISSTEMMVTVNQLMNENPHVSSEWKTGLDQQTLDSNFYDPLMRHTLFPVFGDNEYVNDCLMLMNGKEDARMFWVHLMAMGRCVGNIVSFLDYWTAQQWSGVTITPHHAETLLHIIRKMHMLTTGFRLENGILVPNEPGDSAVYDEALNLLIRVATRSASKLKTDDIESIKTVAWQYSLLSTELGAKEMAMESLRVFDKVIVNNDVSTLKSDVMVIMVRRCFSKRIQVGGEQNCQYRKLINLALSHGASTEVIAMLSSDDTSKFPIDRLSAAVSAAHTVTTSAEAFNFNLGQNINKLLSEIA